MAKNRFFPKLFEPGKIGRVQLKNRIVKAPLGTSTGRGEVTDKTIAHYTEQARGGAAVVCVETARVQKMANPPAHIHGLFGYDDSFLPGLTALAKAIHDNGAIAEIQIGRGDGKPNAFTTEEIEELIKGWGDTARRVQAAGFDMVQLHGAHGNLLTNFVSPITNQRTDKFGGSFENRMRYVTEIVKDIRKKVGPDLPIDMRLSASEYVPGGTTIEDTIKLVLMLEEVGINAVHVSGGRRELAPWQTNSPQPIPWGNHVWAAEALKKAVHIPVIVSGAICTPEFAEAILEGGQADFIGIGRMLWADPYWPQKAEEGRVEDIRPCIRDLDGCQYQMTDKGTPAICTVNVDLGKEGKFAKGKADKPRKVAIVGGGPAGLEAAMVCASRGHSVTLYEKGRLGGRLNEASVPSFMADIRLLVKFYETQMKKLNVDIVHEAATADALNGFDAVVVAVGGTPVKPNIPGINTPLVTQAVDVLTGKSPVGDTVLVVGTGYVGTQTGLWLAQQGKQVIFVEESNDFMHDIWRFDRELYKEWLPRLKVTVYTETKLVSVLSKSAVVADKFGGWHEYPVDNVVLALGFDPQTALKEQLEKQGAKVYAAGDCVQERGILVAIHTGNAAARRFA